MKYIIKTDDYDITIEPKRCICDCNNCPFSSRVDSDYDVSIGGSYQCNLSIDESDCPIINSKEQI